ncbi:uncharacterized protein LOC127586081 isoform X2 [Pristis pectinata]|uniref:uncharacterized protein LOC127586081 isoform X2 n=1 Tax=Pristis pectinata TaxID=685728 RepID=UPI00223E7B51|nr:uncharacterized protein LOC127586081 isoform X2 [Pristis pectinata]
MAAYVTDAVSNLADLTWMKRPQLQRLCKDLGLKAVGKVISNPPPQIQANTTVPRRRDTLDKGASLQMGKRGSKDVPGWCVIHGMQLFSSGWSSLALKCGRPVVVNGDSLVDLCLRPALVETPPHLEDNKICWECLQRNSKEASLKQHHPPKRRSGIPLLIRRHLATLRKDASTPGSSASVKIDSASMSGCTRLGLPREMWGRGHPQEDKAYALKVEELLMKIANGDMTVDQAVRSEQPKVVHSPR